MMDMARLTRHGMVGAVALAVLVVMLLVYRALNAPVTEIRIEGSLSPAERVLLQTALAPVRDARILTADLRALVRDIEALGWPEDVSVRRLWPSTLQLSIRKQSVVARWQDSQFLTSTGRVIDQADVGDDLPRLRVAGTDPLEALETLQQLDQLARGQGLRVAALDFEPARGWRLTQSDSVPVYLGDGPLLAVLRPAYARFLKVRSALPMAARQSLEYADARYDSGVAIKSSPAAAPVLLGQATSKGTGIDER
jgi:cell division septal protein FtsQ